MTDRIFLCPKVASFADDTHIYHKIDSDNSTSQLQTDLNIMYNWSVTNNMLFNAKFQSINYSSHASGGTDFYYTDHEDNPIDWFNHVKTFGIYMPQNLNICNVLLNKSTQNITNVHSLWAGF